MLLPKAAKTKSFTFSKVKFLADSPCRSATVCAADRGQDHRSAGDHRKRPLWGGVAREVARRRRGGQDLLVQGGALLVPRGRDLPDDHAAAREHPGLHRRG